MIRNAFSPRGAMVALGWVAIVVLVSMAVPAATAIAQVGAAHAHLGAGGAALLLPFVMGYLSPLAPPRSVPEMNASRVPISGDCEVYEDVLYDTVTYPAAGVAAGSLLQWFNTSTNLGNSALTNFRNSFQLPALNWFDIHRIFIVPIIENTSNTAGTAVGRVRDLDRVFLMSTSGFQYNNARTSRLRGPVPLSMFGSPGGPIAEFGGAFDATVGVNHVLEHARNSQNGGFPTKVSIGPQENFQANILVGSQQAITADMPLMLLMYGYRYVPIG